MTIKRFLKWSALLILVALGAWLFIAYWSSTNDCGRNIPPGSERMKAIRYCEYGPPDVLKVEEVEKPVPKDDELLVRVRAASLNFIDAGLVRGPLVGRFIFGLRKPKFTGFGQDFAGVVEAVGNNVTEFKAGDEVFGGKRGSVAEYVCVRKDRVALKPANITFEQAGAVKHAGLTALQGLKTGKIHAGQKVLINGASGGVGTFAVQIAKALGAEVTAVCSTRNVGLIRSLGADYVIDYTREDFTRIGERYDLFLDIAGSRSWKEYKRVLKPDATFVIVGAPKGNRVIGPLAHIIPLRLASLRASQKVVFCVASFNCEDFMLLKEMFERGQIKTVVEKSYPLEKISEAMRHLGTGHARGKIVVTME